MHIWPTGPDAPSPEWTNQRLFLAKSGRSTEATLREPHLVPATQVAGLVQFLTEFGQYSLVRRIDSVPQTCTQQQAGKLRELARRANHDEGFHGPA